MLLILAVLLILIFAVAGFAVHWLWVGLLIGLVLLVVSRVSR